MNTSYFRPRHYFYFKNDSYNPDYISILSAAMYEGKTPCKNWVYFKNKWRKIKSVYDITYSTDSLGRNTNVNSATVIFTGLNPRRFGRGSACWVAPDTDAVNKAIELNKYWFQFENKESEINLTHYVGYQGNVYIKWEFRQRSDPKSSKNWEWFRRKF